MTAPTESRGAPKRPAFEWALAGAKRDPGAVSVAIRGILREVSPSTGAVPAQESA